MTDPVRQSMLARMGIQSWQLRRPAMLGVAPAEEAEVASTESPQEAIPQAPRPAGKLWLLAQALPAATMLEDICQLLAIRTDEVTLLSTPPEAHWLQQEPSPLLWLTEADSRWPDALVCPLAPGSAEKRALWQQLQPHLAARTA